ncbi:MAG: sugar ABC transporter permease [Hungatella sp.]|nr:sugar ABC transporter permease [Hungatella sp.]
MKANTSGQKRKIKRSNVEEFLCVLPAVLLVMVTTYYPLADLVRISFTDWNLLRKDYHYVGLKNWQWFLENATGNNFYRDMGTTLKYTIGSVLISLILGLVLALLMSRMTKGFGAMRAIIFLPRYVGMSSAGILFLWILNKDYGIANNVIELMGGSRLAWVTSKGLALMSVLMLTGWHSVGYAMMIYLSAMTGIPSSYQEAAALDGASRTQRFFQITLPLLSPTILFLLVTTFISSMKVFNAIDILTGGGPYGSTEVIVYLIYQLGFVDYRVDRAAVVSLVFFVFLLVVTVLTMRWSENKVNYDM